MPEQEFDLTASRVDRKSIDLAWTRPYGAGPAPVDRYEVYASRNLGPFTLSEVDAEQLVLDPVEQPTPERLDRLTDKFVDVKTSSRLSPDVEVYLKAECLQRNDSFKLRGAYHKMASLSSEEKTRGNLDYQLLRQILVDAP